MKTRTSKNYFAAAAIALFAALALCCVVLPRTFVKAHAAVGDVYTQNFQSATAVNEDFAAYYQITMGSGSTRTVVGESADDQCNWYVSNGELIRKSLDGDISSSYTTDSFAILTLTRKQYVNFDLTVEYSMGASTDYWPVVAFRQQSAGTYFLESGAGVFVQREGKVTLWGSDVDGVGGPYENSVSGYSREGWHTLRVRVDGLHLDVYLDGATQSAMSRTLPSSFFRSGYISLTSVNNETRFRNLRITELEVKPISDSQSQDPVRDAGTSDSLSSMAQYVTAIDELAGHEQTFKPSDGDTHTGCSSTVGGTACVVGTVCVLCAAVFVFTRKLKKKHPKCSK